MKLRTLHKEFGFLAVVVFLSLIVLRDFLGSGYPPSWGGDAYGHLFKVWKLMNGYFPWIEDWYGGYPFLRFYPPLAYYTGALLGTLTASAIWGYKLTAFLAFILGALSMRFLLRELGFFDLTAYAASLAYTFAPYHLRILSPEGNFPRFVGINLAPLFILAFLYLFRRDVKKAVGAGVLLATVFLSHHTLAVTFGFGLLFLIPYFWEERKNDNRELLINFIVAGGVAFLLSAFWFVPFLLEKDNAHFLKENSIEYLFKFQSAKLNDILLPGGSWSFYQGILMYLGLVGSLVIITLEKGKRRLLGAGALVGIIVPIILSLGYYGPVPWINRLPLLDMVPPYRWLDIVGFFSSIGFALLLELFLQRVPHPGPIPKQAKSLVLLLLLIFTLSDIRFHLDDMKSEEFPGDYLAVLNYIKNDNGIGWRYFQWGLATTQGSRVSYTPALTGKPALEGWYRQGDPAYPQHSYLNYAIANDQGFAEKALRAYSIKYVIVDSSHPDAKKAEDTLKSLGFEEVYSSGSFKLYSWNRWGFVEPKANVLVIGDWPLDLGVEYERGSFIDDYADSLEGYSLIILNGYKYRDPIVWKKLEEYVKNGGVLVVNTFRSPDAEASRLGVKSVIVKVFGKANLSSTTYDVYRFSNFTYEGEPWTATAYEGDLTPLLKLGNLTVVGLKEYGNGRVYFVGLNLPYHAVYTKNEYEAEVLSGILKDYLSTPKVEYEVLKLGDGEIALRYAAERSTTILISENYYPHWKAYVGGEEVEVSKDEEFGLIELSLPAGNHELKLRFEDPYAPLRYVSLGTLIIVLAFLLHVPSTRQFRVGR